ncbi:DNA-binding LacI/PurR family transcriptional regulator [Microbacterium resistens]|uniref:DNA-binding LacI/PurR family transcriptional regulator n=1 Tax=Microbacterium resistens TaxID=156977 RepID=A0ABU1S829_9MICO|nr:LacI family DNA-binding transcriptional regulator [Microbacterium resistens]MDR6865764.1 DNA-binding LacI/PurR family transcriptional regulator [Microbacterium resistens]
MARVTLQTIADEVGVSRMTVSNAFSRPNQLSAALRSQIMDAAARLGYSGPDPSGRALARGRTGAIGVVLTNSPRDAFTDETAVGFLRAVAGTLADAGYSLVLLHSSERSDVDPVRDIAMDGAIVYSCAPRAREVTALHERRLPLVTVESAPLGDEPQILLDDAAGSRQAAAHLLELGHRDVALIVTSVDVADEPLTAEHRASASDTIGRRLDGWTSELATAGVAPRIVGTTGFDVDDVLRDRIGAMLETPPTAVLAFSDLAALEVIEQARARGIRVPEDLSVVGFDDSPLAARLSPPLTTVHQDVDAKGTAAATTLLALLKEEKPTTLTLPTSLVVRGSTAAAPRR